MAGVGVPGRFDGLAVAPAGSRTALIEFGPAAMEVSLLIATTDGVFHAIDSRSLPPVSAADVTAVGLAAIVAAVVETLRVAGISSPSDLHGLYLSGDVAADPAVRQAFQPLCANQQLRYAAPQPVSVLPRAVVPPPRARHAAAPSPGSAAVPRLVWIVAAAVATLVVTAVAIGFFVTSGGDDHPRYPTAAVGKSGDFNYSAVDAGAGRLYVGNQQDKSVSVVDTANRKAVATIPLPDRPMGVAVDPALHRLYVVGRGDGSSPSADKASLFIIDTGSNQIVRTLVTGRQSWGVAVDSASHRVYVVNVYGFETSTDAHRTNPNGASTLSVIDPQSQSIVASIDIGANAMNIAIDPGTRTAYIAAQHINSSNTIDTLVAVGLDTNRVIDSFGVGKDVNNTFDLAVDPAFHTVYVTVDGKVMVVDPATKSVVRAFDAKGYPSIALDPVAHAAYVNVSDGSTKLLVLDTRTGSVTATIDCGKESVHGVGVDPQSHTVYVLAYDSVLFVSPPKS